jgi:hypothetical protein
MFTIVRAQTGVEGDGLSDSCTGPVSPSLHKEGVSMYMRATDDLGEAVRYASHIFDAPQKLERFRIGGGSCSVCKTSSGTSSSSRSVEIASRTSLPGRHPAAKMVRPPHVRHEMRIGVRRQNRALKMRWKKKANRISHARARGFPNLYLSSKEDVRRH